MEREAEVRRLVRANPARALIGLDFDGTLSNITEEPSLSRLVPGALDALLSLTDNGVTVAVISGRPAQDVVQLGDLGAVPALRVMGHYGMQVWRGGQLASPQPHPGVQPARERLAGLLAVAPDGVVVEDKELSLVVHTRRARSPQETLDELTPALRSLAGEVGLEASPGKFVLELRPRGVDKGDALKGLVEETDPAVVVYIGDDVGDLPAFELIARLRDQGRPALAIAVEAPDLPEPVRSSADHLVGGPAEVVTWLASLTA